MKYQEYLGSRHWKKTRADALEHFDFECCLCESDRRLETHHWTYKRVWAEQISDLAVVCELCHRLIHMALDTDLGWLYGYCAKWDAKVSLLEERQRSGVLWFTATEIHRLRERVESAMEWLTFVWWCHEQKLLAEAS